MPSETTTTNGELEPDLVDAVVDVPGADDEAIAQAEPVNADYTGESTSRRVRRRLARLGTVRAPSGPPELGPLFRTLRATHPKADLRVVQRAYEVAEVCHRGQARRSGDPYITHPLAVAQILAEIGMTETEIAAALLHDTVEDTAYTLDELRGDFGDGWPPWSTA